MTSTNGFAGTWTYRSFRNVPAPLGDLDDPKNMQKYKEMLFAEADLVVEESPVGTLVGKLDMGSFGELHIKGSISYGNPFSCRFQGVGTDGPPTGWVYDYVGYLIPNWPNGVDQQTAMVGSVIRTVRHGNAPAGYVASFIAVRR